MLGTAGSYYIQCGNGAVLWCGVAQRAPSSPSLDRTHTSAATTQETLHRCLIWAQGLTTGRGREQRICKSNYIMKHTWVVHGLAKKKKKKVGWGGWMGGGRHEFRVKAVGFSPERISPQRAGLGGRYVPQRCSLRSLSIF